MPYGTTLVETPTESRMETSINFDLSQDGQAHYVSLVVPSDELTFLTDGQVKSAQELEIGDSVHLTGDKVGVVQSVEHKLFTPQPQETDGRGNVFSRVIGKSERSVETMLYLHTKNEVIKTTPEHPFYVGGTWIEAQYLNPGDEIRTRTGKTMAVEYTETVHDPQMVYSLLVEGTHNFYVGEDGLLAHNCTPQLGRKLEYFFGNATGSTHNIQRSLGMQDQLNRVGIFDNDAGRALMTDHLTEVLNDSTNIVRVQDNGRAVRESLLCGPQGCLKFETIWEDNKLITGTLFGQGN